MDFSCPIIFLVLLFFVLVSFVCPIYSSEISKHQLVNQTTQSKEEFYKLKKAIKTHLQQINKPGVKTIQSPDGDIIDCVLTHEQPAFDHPLLKGQKPLDPPEIPIDDHNQMNNFSDIFQSWTLSGESCPDGTIPIIRTKEQDILRAGSISRFGKKFVNDDRHDHAIGFVNGNFYGARASLNVWTPKVENQGEFSLAQIWVLSDDRNVENTLEAGWQVFPHHYGDNRPRLFTYWTADGYRSTGCFNLNCPCFVQVNKKIVLGGSIAPTSTYNGKQFEIKLTIWKDPKSGNWWLGFGSIVVGYWPTSMFQQLKGTAHAVQFGGEVTNFKPRGSHTSTQMGSGHFVEEGWGKAAYIRNLVVVNTDHLFHSLTEQPKFFVQRPNCYNIKGGNNKDVGGQFILYGGPGRNKNCP
ncbi:uncharacterized protein LOC123922908 [Trifolium pratense]|uniref:uncharacterized protein LOC123922908 n=1 Tax=Trifolium pratense TaxID=57577 RepID=UPI001E693970|nr:uncharacterized protein LOC123922908 [Trifolium pratense]